jgi:valyl-tRNA synthetase
MELEKSYDASLYEADIYKQWMDSGYFNPDNLPNTNGEAFSMVLPPPNVTGTLHLGHAFEQTLQDIIIRYHRMLGKKTLWVPGTDHAAIATQSKVEKILDKEEGKRKTDLGREVFLTRVEEFAQTSHDTIINQMKKLGLSLDWDREAYTLDQDRNLAVRTAFKAMYDDGLIYRAYKVVNMDPKGQTVISDDEVVHEERDAKLYTFKYSADFPISIATTRPETKVGDTAVAVNPTDERYQQYIGKEYDIEFCGVPIHIKIVADDIVEKEFGTGALGVTPAHSMIDADLAERHNLPFKSVINEFARMTVGGENLLNKKTTEAREVVVEWLKENNLLENEESIKQNIATAERTGGIIEPIPKMQWFLAVNKTFKIKHSEIEGITAGQEVTLKQLMRHVIETNQIKIAPDRFSKTYFHWIDNLRDWCISRQIWFGHRIPVWYKNEEIYCGIEAPEGEGWQQDEDTLDTWFSSGLWTFSTLGWPNQTEDLKTFHPTSVVAPGYEILFFWVARMILMSTYNIGQIPFKEVYIHGIVRDKQGRKFSKSLNNGIDPLEMIEKYGTDALRFALVSGTAPGNDVLFDEQKVKGMKHFGNKIWNIARYILINLEENVSTEHLQAQTEADKLILEQLNQTIRDVSNQHIHEGAQTLYQFIWHDFADIYIEASKLQMQDEKLKAYTQQILLHVLTNILKLLHPFMPFLTEVLWQKLYSEKLVEDPILMIAKWPEVK